MQEIRQSDAVTVLLEFKTFTTQQTFEAILPDRDSPRILSIDPLELIAGFADSPDGYPRQVARRIASSGVREVRLCANCRGTALLAPTAHHLAELGVRTREVLAVDPVAVTGEVAAQSLLEIARSLNISDPTVSDPLLTTLDAVSAQVSDWLDRFIGELGVDAEEGKSIKADLHDLYVRWLGYQRWAVASRPPSIACGRVTVAAVADPGSLEQVFSPTTVWELALFGRAGASLFDDAGVVKLIRDFALA